MDCKVCFIWRDTYPCVFNTGKSNNKRNYRREIMRLKDVRKAGAYLGRIVHDPFSRQSRAALIRYFRGAFSIIYEKICGLDFTMGYD